MSDVSKVQSKTNHFRHGFLSSCCVVEFFCLAPLWYLFVYYMRARTLSCSFDRSLARSVVRLLVRWLASFPTEKFVYYFISN